MTIDLLKIRFMTVFLPAGQPVGQIAKPRYELT
jgi:hypothetical protein